MARVRFTKNLERHVQVSDVVVERAATVREALDAVFAQSPALKSYVLDDQGALRRHMIIFIDGRQISDREQLADAVSEQAEIYVMQALSGG
jgi:molybdopterin converting factor small subunit